LQSAIAQRHELKEERLDFIWILVAFIAGLASRAINLPPLVGYLLAGFGLNALGMTADSTISQLADLGVTLMLFTIGLKLNPTELIKKEVAVGSLGHMTLWILIGSATLWLLGSWLANNFDSIHFTQVLLIIFALSFSSTVAVVKTLDESGEMKTQHANLALAILVAQDIIAVIFLAISTGKPPSIFTILLPLLIFARPALDRLIKFAGHGELMPLLGLVLALGGYYLFEALSLKGDLGALAFGMLVSQHPKSNEIHKSLMNVKDLFLIGFFLSIGFIALPTAEMMGLALLLCLMLPLKALLFYGLFTLLKIRTRTVFLTALVLTNFSEFGLIVGANAVETGLIEESWLVTLAITVTLSFVFTAIIYPQAHNIFSRLQPLLLEMVPQNLTPKNFYVTPTSAKALVIGMGRVGRGAYRALEETYGESVWGTDADRQRVLELHHKKYRVCYADAEDPELWQQLRGSGLQVIVIALPSLQDMVNVAKRVREVGIDAKLVGLARYADQIPILEEAGIDIIYNFYTEAGVGLVKQSLERLRKDESFIPAVDQKAL